MNELDQIKELHDMLNIGLGFEKDLKKVGINTPDELRKIDLVMMAKGKHLFTYRTQK